MKERRRLNIWFAMAIFLPVMVSTANAVERHVPGQYATIQAAIDTCINGDIVIVAPGTYTGPGNRGIDFLGKAITVRSTDPNDPNIVAATIIDCNGTREEPHRGFYFHSGETSSSVLDGLTVTNGYGLFIAVGHGGNILLSVGGGIYCIKNSSPTISNCIISANTADEGGGILAGGSPTISNCTITGNKAVGGGGILYATYSNLTISNCTITGNRASSGGGIYCRYGGNSMVSNCTIAGNSADIHGGGISLIAGNPTFSNCTITGNSAGNNGGGIRCYHTNPLLTNCVLWDNTAANGPEIAIGRTAVPSHVTVSYSDVQGGQAAVYIEEGCTLTWYDGNIEADPCFVSLGYWAPNDPNAVWIDGDYHLLPDSPCIDAGIDAGVYADIEGNVRPFDFPGVDNNGDLPDFDIGAYEAVLPTPYETATESIGEAIAGKLKALQRIDAAAEKEWAAYEALEEWLESEDYGDLNKRDIVKARQRIHTAIQHEEQSKNALEKSIEWLEDALRTLGYEFKPPTLNEPPMALIGAPENGAVFYYPVDMIKMEAYTWDVDGLVVKVEFFADANKVGEDNDRADGWKTTWWYPAPGAHCLTARATDDLGTTATSPPVGIAVFEEPPPKGRLCFPADTDVWVDGVLVQISKVSSGQKVGKLDGTGATACLKQIEKVEEHMGTFECYDIVLEPRPSDGSRPSERRDGLGETGNCISVVGSHLFLVESGQWKRVENLQSGSKLKSLQGLINIRSVTKRAVPFTGKVYNLKVKGGERYFAGKDGVIVRDW